VRIQRAWKYKLELNLEQESVLSLWLSHLRCLYNLALEHRILNYQQFRKSMNYYDQANQLSDLKEAFPWLAEVPSQCLQQKLKDVETAYKKFFTGLGGFPKYKSKYDHMAMRFPDAKQFSVSFRKGKRTSVVKLPKIGQVKFVSSREMQGQIKNCTVSKQADGFYISFQTEVDFLVLQTRKNPIGIDRGVNTMGMTSEGECLETPVEKIKAIEVKMQKAQKILSKKQKGSRNRHKARIKVALLHQKITNLRKDNLQKITHSITKSHGLVVIEDLKIKNMTASSSGTISEPGSRVAQKSGLNRSILRNGWGELERQLSYKLAWSGGELRKVPAHYTSQMCAECGHVHSENRDKEQFLCLECGHSDHADINAAKNILALGQSVSVCGEASVGVLVKTRTRRASMKQKPLSA